MAYALQQRMNQEQQVASLKNDRDDMWRTHGDTHSFSDENRMTYSSNNGIYSHHHHILCHNNTCCLIGFTKVKDENDVKRTSYIGSSSSSQAAAIEAACCGDRWYIYHIHLSYAIINKLLFVFY